jgi:hypothetical protein
MHVTTHKNVSLSFSQKERQNFCFTTSVSETLVLLILFCTSDGKKFVNMGQVSFRCLYLIRVANISCNIQTEDASPLSNSFSREKKGNSFALGTLKSNHIR